MNRKQLVEQMKTHLAEVERIQTEWDGKQMPQEQIVVINDLLGKVDGAKAAIHNLERLASAKDFLGESAGSAAMEAAHHGFRKSAPDEGMAEVDEKSWRELKVPTPSGEVSIRYNVPLAVQDPDYKNAFDEYCRKGFREMRGSGQKTLRIGTDSAGGFLVPEDYQMEMIRKVATMTVFRQYARVIQTSRDQVSWPRIKYSADDNYTSGVRMTWTGEVPSSSTVHRATEPVFGKLNIPVHTAMASIPLTNDLLEDSAFDVEGITSELLGEAFGLGEDAVFWTGSGAGQPLGIITNIDTTDGVASVNSGSASTLTDDGLIDLIYALPSQYEQGARIFWRKATEKVVRKLKNTTTDEYVWPAEERVGAFGTVERTILGHPISKSEFVPAIAGDAFPIIFGQLSGYVVVDRVGMSIQRLDELYAESNMVLLLARKRVGGAVAEPWRLRAQKISNS